MDSTDTYDITADVDEEQTRHYVEQIEQLDTTAYRTLQEFGRNQELQDLLQDLPDGTVSRDSGQPLVKSTVTVPELAAYHDDYKDTDALLTPRTPSESLLEQMLDTLVEITDMERQERRGKKDRYAIHQVTKDIPVINAAIEQYEQDRITEML